MAKNNDYHDNSGTIRGVAVNFSDREDLPLEKREEIEELLRGFVNSVRLVVMPFHDGDKIVIKGDSMVEIDIIVDGIKCVVNTPLAFEDYVGIEDKANFRERAIKKLLTDREDTF